MQSLCGSTVPGLHHILQGKKQVFLEQGASLGSPMVQVTSDPLHG
jgi:hypothetical protein